MTEVGMFPVLSADSWQQQELSESAEAAINSLVPEGRSLVADWARQLRLMGDQLIQSEGVIKSGVEAGGAIEQWLKDKTHGAEHSYHVYEGAKYLAEMDNQNKLGAVEDREMQLLAVVHDWMRFFNGVHLETGEKIGGWEETKTPKHAVRAAIVMRVLGASLGFNREKTRQIVRNLMYHDMVFDNRSDKKRQQAAKRMDAVGRWFHDADKLYAFGVEKDVLKMAEAVIDRNRLGSYKPEGWYL